MPPRPTGASTSPAGPPRCPPRFRSSGCSWPPIRANDRKPKWNWPTSVPSPPGCRPAAPGERGGRWRATPLRGAAARPARAGSSAASGKTLGAGPHVRFGRPRNPQPPGRDRAGQRAPRRNPDRGSGTPLTRMIRQNAERIAQTVDDVLDVARVEHHRSGPLRDTVLPSRWSAPSSVIGNPPKVHGAPTDCTLDPNLLGGGLHRSPPAPGLDQPARQRPALCGARLADSGSPRDAVRTRAPRCWSGAQAHRSTRRSSAACSSLFPHPTGAPAVWGSTSAASSARVMELRSTMNAARPRRELRPSRATAFVSCSLRFLLPSDCRHEHASVRSDRPHPRHRRRGGPARPVRAGPAA